MSFLSVFIDFIEPGLELLRSTTSLLKIFIRIERLLGNGNKYMNKKNKKTDFKSKVEIMLAFLCTG